MNLLPIINRTDCLFVKVISPEETPDYYLFQIQNHYLVRSSFEKLSMELKQTPCLFLKETFESDQELLIHWTGSVLNETAMMLFQKVPSEWIGLPKEQKPKCKTKRNPF